MNKTELLTFLNHIGARPKKGLSQNFLIDQHILHKIVQLADVGSQDFILEVGPGPGALTQQLLKTGAHVVAVEKDALFAEHLMRLQTADQRLEVVSADFLKWRLPQSSHKWKVVANLPYNITTPILEKICMHANCFHSITIMVQKEVADRICAKPKTKAFGSLTLFLQFYMRYIDSFLVLPHCFFPAPTVDSTVLRLDMRAPPAVDPVPLFQIIHKTYQQRRKMIATTLRPSFPNIVKVLTDSNISPMARPEELSLNDWIRLFDVLVLKHA